MGAYPQVAIAFAEKETPFSDVTAPMDELRSFLRQRFYRRQLPSLDAAEHSQADTECRLVKAEISQNARELRDAARAELIAAETIIEVLDASA